jgi:multiple sugar transport system substrate-binding protein
MTSTHLFFRMTFNIFFAACLVACDALGQTSSSADKATGMPQVQQTETPFQILQPTNSQKTQLSATPDPSQILTIWLPPEFDPQSNSNASQLMLSRLQEFEKSSPNIRIQVRIKNASGTEGMLEALSLTHAVAPLALPSVAILSYSDLGTAIRQDLIYPLSSIPALTNVSDWYPYSTAMAISDQKWYGAPFAGDALILVHRPNPGKQQDLRWDDIIQYSQPVYFPASDSNALTTLALYQSIAGESSHFINAQSFHQETLTRVFTFYQQGAQHGIFPYSLSQYDRFEQTWAAYNNHQTRWVITWASDYLKTSNQDTTAAPLPGLGGAPFTLATGSLLVLTEPNANRQTSSLMLMEFLLDSKFLSAINEATGTLPTRPSANHYPADTEKQGLIEKIVQSAAVQPVPFTYPDLAKDLNDATNQVIRFRLNPQDAAKTIVDENQKVH